MGLIKFPLDPQLLDRYSEALPADPPRLVGGSVRPISDPRALVINIEENDFGARSTPTGSTGHNVAPPSPLRPSPSLSQPNPLASTVGRDAIMTYAYRLYQDVGAKSSGSRYTLSPVPVFDTVQNVTSSTSQLVSLLSTLRSLHPRYLPVLLLLSSVHFTQGDYVASLRLNQEILQMDPQYVEAMCNTGIIMKQLDRPILAYKWWWKALQIQPTYWEVTVRLHFCPCLNL